MSMKTETRNNLGRMAMGLLTAMLAAPQAGPKTINDEVQLLLSLCGEQGALVRATLRRDKSLKLALPPSPGRPYSAEEKARMKRHRSCARRRCTRLSRWI